MVSLRLLIIYTFSVLFVLAGMETPLFAQNQKCTTLGQTPATAFPVCGSSTFTQTSVPACVNGSIPVPGCDAAQASYGDLNPYWYKFTCFTAGTLGLTIAPKKASDDYDWQLFDITGHDPSEVYTNSGLYLACNWSGLTGNTGTSAAAASLTECSSDGNFNPPIFSKMPSLIQGHNYLLMISHFSGDSQSGYDLSFTGGTASITDTVPPALKSVTAICDDKLRVVLNKKMKCNSLAADGSDFSVSSAAISVISAVSTNCSGFDMDTLELRLSGHLAPGSYTLTAGNGTDGNTVLDNCETQVPAGSTLPFQLAAPQPTPLDSLTIPGCATDVLQLVFPKKIMCSTIAPNGSDFVVTGAAPVTIAGASANCDADGEGNIITLQLTAPIVNGGNYQLQLANGIDGNTIVDECGLSTPAGVIIPFVMKDTVSASFDDLVKFGCKADTILFYYADKNGVDQWRWSFDDGAASTVEDPSKIYTVFGDKPVQLIVSNGFCSDTATAVISLDNAIDAAFEAPSILCPTDAALIKNNSTGKILVYTWDFGDGTGSSDAQPADHLYPMTGVEKKYEISLVIDNIYGCHDTAVWKVDVLRSCYIAVPSAFTPNGDGMNDYLYPLNAYKADHLEFRVYNRVGQLVFTGRDWLQKWDGTINGHPQPAGAYVWMLQYTDRDTGKKMFQKGTSVLIR